jgi:hypothetical protein
MAFMTNDQVDELRQQRAEDRLEFEQRHRRYEIEEEDEVETCPFCKSNKIHESINYFECLNCLAFGPSENSPANLLKLTAKELWNFRG